MWTLPHAAPTIEKLAGEYEGKVKVGKMNTDENQETPGGLRISAIPTVLVFQGGKEVDRLVGVNTETKFKASLTKLGSDRGIDRVALVGKPPVAHPRAWCPFILGSTRRLMPDPPAPVRVKVCGLTSVADALALPRPGPTGSA